MKKPAVGVIECEYRNDLGCLFLVFTPDGRSVGGFLSEMGKHTGIARWDAETGKLIETRKENSRNRADFVARSDDGGRLAVRFFGQSVVRILDGASFKPISKLEVQTDILAWSADGERLAISFCDEIKCWDVAKKSEVTSATLKKTREIDESRFVGFLPEGKEIVVGRDSGIVTWNLQNKKVNERTKFAPRNGDLWEHGLSRDRSVMLSLSDRGCLVQTDTRTWKSTQFKTVKSAYSHAFTFSPDGKLAAARTGDGTVFIWDVIEGREWLKWKKPHYGSLRSITFSPDGQRLACILDFKPFILDFRSGAKGSVPPQAAVPAGKRQCVQMVGPDDRMDHQSGGREPLNPLPVKCAKCRMPDLDFITNPYLLNRGIASPAELFPAEEGNFLVRQKARQVLESVAPGECKFHPTIHYKTKEATPWFLAVPQHLETTATPPADRERCPECGEPCCFHDYSESAVPGSHESPFSGHDVFKSKNWSSATAPFTSWRNPRPELFGRHLYFSVRLETLFKKLHMMHSLVRSYGCKQEPTDEDMAWVETKLLALKESSDLKKEGKTGDSKQWFADYLKKNSRKKSVVCDFVAVEKKHKLKLPELYKAFMTKVGTKTFKDLDGEEGYTVHILPPQKLDFKDLRRAPDDDTDEAEKRIDGVVFGSTDHGDAFCFDVAGKNRDYPVYKYDHEIDTFEPYAGNFADCIKRMTGD